MPYVSIFRSAKLRTASTFALAIDAVSGAWSGSATVENFGVQATLDVGLKRSPHNITPHEVTVYIRGFSGFQNAVYTNDDFKLWVQQLEFRVVVEGETGTFEKPLSAIDRNRFEQYGPLATFVLREPGLKTVKVFAREIGTSVWGAWQQSFTVGNSDDFFTGDEVFVSSIADDPDAPAGWPVYTSTRAALDARQGASDRTRFTYKSGFREQPTSGHDIDMDTFGHDVLHFRAEPGAAVRPVIDMSAIPTAGAFAFRVYPGRGDADPGKECVIAGLGIRGGWNVVDEVSEVYDLAGNVVAADGQSHRTYGIASHSSWQALNHFLVDDCEISGLTILVNGQGRATAGQMQGITVHDCSLRNWQDVGCYSGISSNFCAVIGSRVARDDDAARGGPKGTVNPSNIHGCIRLSARGVPHVTNVQQCDLVPIAGWTEALQSGGNSSGWYVPAPDNLSRGGPRWQYPQPPLRLNTNQQPGSLSNVQRNYLVGGYHCINMTAQNADRQLPRENFVVQRNYMIADHAVGSMVAINGGGAKITHNVFVMPDQKRPSANEQVMVDLSAVEYTPALDPPNDPAVLALPVMVEYNTFINEVSAANDRLGGAFLPIREIRSAGERRYLGNGDAGAYFTGVTVQNNAVHRPNSTDPLTSDGPYSRDVLFPHDQDALGYRHNAKTAFPYERPEFPLDTALRTPAGANIGGGLRPDAGGIGSATDPWATWDMEGNEHDGQNLGAWASVHRPAD